MSQTTAEVKHWPRSVSVGMAGATPVNARGSSLSLVVWVAMYTMYLAARYAGSLNLVSDVCFSTASRNASSPLAIVLGSPSHGAPVNVTQLVAHSSYRLTHRHRVRS